MMPAWKRFNRDVRATYPVWESVKFADWDFEELLATVQPLHDYPLKVREIALWRGDCVKYVIFSAADDFDTLPKATRKNLPAIYFDDEKDIDSP